MKILIFKLLFFFVVINLSAQTKKQKDINAIKSMCGCFEVNFKFAETFSYSKDSIYKSSENYSAGALEWAQLVNDEKNNIIIQHILIAGDEDNPYVIKHWRQDWLYENSDFYYYDHSNKWIYKHKKHNEVKGQWSQKVYQVDDSPRYEGTASWIHVDGRSFWSNSTDAPLPRREITKRQDYNVMLRRNNHEIFDWGWQHDQDNDKIIRESGKEDFVLAQEKGINNYIRVESKRCLAAQNFWKENKDKWSLVRNKWDNIFNYKNDIKLKNKFNEKRLYQYLFSLESSVNEEEVSKIIDNFISI
jgi:hypothetical protein